MKRVWPAATRNTEPILAQLRRLLPATGEFLEIAAGTDPQRRDTDHDGLADGAEAAENADPLVADSDGDGIPDGAEVRVGARPDLADSDGDGVDDGDEVRPLAAS